MAAPTFWLELIRSTASLVASSTCDWIDTKVDAESGARHVDVTDAVRGPGTVYGWIQGRGLEAPGAFERPPALPVGVPAS